MVEWVALVVSVGLADSLNPTTLAPALVLATGPHAVRRMTAFTLGVFAVSFAGGLVLVAGPGELILNALPHPSHRVRQVAAIAGGVLLFVLAVVVWIRRAQIASRQNDASSAGTAGGRRSLAAGAAVMAIELPTAFPYFAAIAAVIAETGTFVGRLALVALYNVAFVSPLIGLIVLRSRASGDADGRVAAAIRALREGGPAALAVLLAVVGAGLVTYGFARW